MAMSIEQKFRARKVLADPNTFAPTLLALLVDAFGLEALSWHPETIRDSIEEFYSVKMPDDGFDALMAAIAVVTTDIMWVSLDGFARTAEALSGEGANWNVPPMPDILECSWAIAQSQLLHPDGTITAHPDIAAYLELVMADEGMLVPPAAIAPIVGEVDMSHGGFDWTDDPASIAAVYDEAHIRAQEIDTAVQALLVDLADELKAVLPHRLPQDGK